MPLNTRSILSILHPYCASLPTPTGTISSLLLWLQFSPERDGRNFWPKALFPHHWPCHSFLVFLHHFPSCYTSYISLWVLMFTVLLCLCLQPSLCSIPPFCLGHTLDMLPSSCLYVCKHLFLVSFPVFFRLQHNLPSWLFTADSNGSLSTQLQIFSEMTLPPILILTCCHESLPTSLSQTNSSKHHFLRY